MPDETWLRSPDGLTLLRPFASSPYPHPSRAQGHTYQGKLFDAITHYSDSTVGLVIPAGFRPSQSTDFIIHTLDLLHDEVLMKRNYFELFLKTGEA
nr:hypothetical protein [Armatimonas sp.]